MVDVDLQPKDRSCDLVGSNPDEKALRALAYVVHSARPEWPYESVLTVLREQRRAFDVIANIAIHAALDQTARTPGVIAHRAPCTTATTERTLTPPPFAISYRNAVPPNDAWHQARQRSNHEEASA